MKPRFFPLPVPWLAVRLLCVAAAAFGVSVFYMLWLNPSVTFDDALYRVKKAWSEKLAREHGPKTVIFGGSSCTFSIDGERLLREMGLPVANWGGGAAFGNIVLTQCALSATRPGDTLIVAVEMVAIEPEPTGAGVVFSYAAGHPEWAQTPWRPAPPGGTLVRLFRRGTARSSQILSLRPGGSHLALLLGKLLSGAPLYRYTRADIHPGGWMTTPVRPPFHPQGEWRAPRRLSGDTRAWLAWLRDAAARRQVRLAYSPPWAYSAPANRGHRARWAALSSMAEVARYMPVLRDPALGFCFEKELYADTLWHLNERGAALRTAAVGRALKNGEVWSREELLALAEQERAAMGRRD